MKTGVLAFRLKADDAVVDAVEAGEGMEEELSRDGRPLEVWILRWENSGTSRCRGSLKELNSLHCGSGTGAGGAVDGALLT